MQLEEVVASLRPHLDGALIATDFDGTLSHLVPDPDSSAPVDGAIEAFAALERRGAQLAVITGRDAETAVRLAGLAAVPEVVVAGLYGLETWTGGHLSTMDTPDAVEQLRERLPDALAGADPDLWIEDKRLSLVVHARKAQDPAAALAAIAEAVTALGDELGFDVHPGRDVLELRLPGFDKAGALSRLAQGRTAMLYIGDDLGDVPAFAEIGRLRDGGANAHCVAVRSSGVQAAVDAADAAVDGPEDVVALFRALAVPQPDGASPSASS
jgi:trehalose 6-phosphate phosphatase